jgi:hypothetical protein
MMPSREITLANENARALRKRLPRATPARRFAPPSPQGGGIKIYLGSVVVPIRYWSIARAHSRPSRIAHTTSDCPRRMSPAENTLGSEVL